MATAYEREPEWQEAPANDASNFRSVTPAMNNIRRNSSPARGFGDEGNGMPAEEKKDGPSSSGLIRLALRKPMGIVFEPMYDPNSPSVQRGVRICDLPRTGAAALSRKLEVGDELLSINDKTMSRLTFDEIMDFIIEADPEQVNLLFRRPRKEVLNARNGNKPPSGGPGVKWVDDDERKSEKKKDSKKEKKSRRSRGREDDETLQTEDDISYRRSRRSRRRHNPYESESFLDILIDTICANPDSVCRDRRRMGDDETYYSEDDETYASRDDSTYVTYESEPSRRKSRKSRKKNSRRDDYSSQGNDDDTREEKARSKPSREREPEDRRPSPPREAQMDMAPIKEKPYEDDGTLETVDSQERAKAMQMQAPEPEPVPVPPLGLVPNPEPTRGNLPPPQIDEDEQTNPAAPIKAVEFDEDADVGADVSVMESLGGPSLLIEKQRQAQILAAKPEVTPPVPRDIADNFGLDYPLDFGFSREQTIQNDPLRFYSFVVKGLLQEHEPEKVRLLDKLLAKYKGREDHLVQKLSVRYNTEDPAEEEAPEPKRDEQGFTEPANFDEAVIRAKGSAHSMENIEAARERMNSFSPTNQWPDKETKEQEPMDEPPQMADEAPEEGSHYSDEDIDGTSPAVIAQVSELLNYVYGKTSVPGQIDRVSTIMRAYEGREAVLLELLETKALIKANREKENAGNLPAFLRNSMNAQREVDEEAMGNGDMPGVAPMAMEGRPAINDDMSSMSGVAPPAPPENQKNVLNTIPSPSDKQKYKPTAAPESNAYNGPSTMAHSMEKQQVVPQRSPTASGAAPMDPKDSKKKKKGIFGGLFKKGKKDTKTGRSSSNGRGLRSSSVKKTEASI